MDAIAREEEGSTHESLGKGGTACLAGPHGDGDGGGGEGSMAQSLYWGSVGRKG